MRTLLRIIEVAFGAIIFALLLGAGEAGAAPATDVEVCVDLGALGSGCDGDADGVTTDVADDVTGQVTVCGNSVAVLGESSSSCAGTQRRSGSDDASDSGEGWIDADVGGSASAQGTVCGNAVGVAGDARASCDGNQAQTGTAEEGSGGGAVSVDVLRWGLVAQATACGNGIAALGEADASCEGAQDAEGSGGDGSAADVGGAGTARAVACGNSVAVGGKAATSCAGRIQPSEGEAPGVVGGDLSAPPPDPSEPSSEVLGAGGLAGALGIAALTGAMIRGIILAASGLLILGVTLIWASKYSDVGKRPRGG